jgi:hypothetical protein
VIGVGGLAAGTIFGVIALADRPAAGAQTTDSYGYAAVENAESKAHTWAIRSDVAFGIGAAGIAATAILFFARTRVSASPSATIAGRSIASIVVSGTPLRGGGGLLVEARF